jgi:DNA ligase D-like protein (predicted 3'-phosphoesterase)
VSAHAVRAAIRGDDAGTALRDAIAGRARELGVLGWVRYDDDGAVRVHAEGERPAVDELMAFATGGRALELGRAKLEGHEQFGVRGVSAGVFVVQEHQATAHHFDLRLEVDGVMRSWAVPKGPSLDPKVKRFAIEVGDHAMSHNTFESDNVIVWDRGTYEQGGRVAWPEALERGHAVFVLHGEKLRGGFALQRTRGSAAKPQWLLIKRRDESARPGSDIAAERPESVLGGRALGELG